MVNFASIGTYFWYKGSLNAAFILGPLSIVSRTLILAENSRLSHLTSILIR